MMWPELFGQFWGLVILTVMVVALAYVALILCKCRADEIEQGRPPERFWRPLMGATLGLCLLHVGIGIFVALGLY
jgi:hypothetical protein